MPLPNQDATQVVTNNGLRTQYGVIIPPGAKVAAYVRSTGIQNDGNDAFLSQNLVTTLAAGLARARAGFGDFVVCLPGHTETVDAAQSAAFAAALVAGTKILGGGRGSNTPTFTWTVAASSWVIAPNDVMISGLRLLAAGPSAGGGAVTTIAISVTGNDFGFYNNDVEMVSATVNAASTMTISGTAARYDISGNVFRGQLTSVVTNQILISSTGADGRFCDNEVISPGAVASLISVTGVCQRLKLLRNTIYNVAAGSTACVAFAAVASDGVFAGNMLGVKNSAGTASAQGVTFGAGCLVVAMQNYCTDTAQASGLLSPPANT